MTAGTRAPISAMCTGAVQLDWPEQHARCAGNQVVRLPGDDARMAPVQTYRCGCDCHTKSAVDDAS